VRTLGNHFTTSWTTLLQLMKTHRPTSSKTPTFPIYWLSFIGLLALVSLVAVPDAVMCDGDTSCIEYKSGLLDGTVRKMTSAEALQFWKEADQATPAVPGAPASQLDGANTRCPPLELKILTLRIRTLSPSPLCLWMA
jgi:hypothetical protein